MCQPLQIELTIGAGVEGQIWSLAWQGHSSFKGEALYVRHSSLMSQNNWGITTLNFANRKREGLVGKWSYSS